MFVLLRSCDYVRELFLYDPIDRDAAVGAYSGAGGAADAVVGLVIGHKVIASVVDVFGLQSEDITRTGDHAEVAAFATFLIDVYCS